MANPLLVQSFLRSGSTVEQLAQLYGIDSKRHGEFPNLVLLKYNQISSPMHEPLVQECRGIILDEADDWRVVARPFDKFFNQGEQLAHPIDWSTARVQEKLDGSLCTLYTYQGKWRVSTSGSPDAAGQVNDHGFTFDQLFWDTFRSQGLKTPSVVMAGHLNFIFELTTPHNRVVVAHKEPRVTLIGVRNRMTGHESHVDQFADLFPVVKQFALGSVEDVVGTFDQLNPLEQEGYVVVDANFHRVKVKHPGYVALHHMRDTVGASRRNMLEVVRKGEIPEVITHFPEFKKEIEDMMIRLDGLVGQLETQYDEIRNIAEQKEFALRAVKTRCPAALFNVRKGMVPSIRQHLADMNVDHLLVLLDLK